MNESDPQRYVTLNGEKVPLNIVGELKNSKDEVGERYWDLFNPDGYDMEETDKDPIYNENMKYFRKNIFNIPLEDQDKIKMQNIMGFVGRNTGLRKNSSQYNVSNKEGNIGNPHYRFDQQWVDYDVLKSQNN